MKPGTPPRPEGPPERKPLGDFDAFPDAPSRLDASPEDAAMAEENRAAASHKHALDDLEQEVPHKRRSTLEEAASEPPNGGSNPLDDGWPQ